MIFALIAQRQGDAEYQLPPIPLPGFTVPVSGYSPLDYDRYLADETLRVAINSLVAHNRIVVIGWIDEDGFVIDAPPPFPVLTAREDQQEEAPPPLFAELGLVPVLPDDIDIDGIPIGEARIYAVSGPVGIALMGIIRGTTASLTDGAGGTWIARRAGAEGNLLAVEVLKSDDENQPLTVVLDGRTLRISLATGGPGATAYWDAGSGNTNLHVESAVEGEVGNDRSIAIAPPPTITSQRAKSAKRATLIEAQDDANNVTVRLGGIDPGLWHYGTGYSSNAQDVQINGEENRRVRIIADLNPSDPPIWRRFSDNIQIHVAPGEVTANDLVAWASTNPLGDGSNGDAGAEHLWTYVTIELAGWNGAGTGLIEAWGDDNTIIDLAPAAAQITATVQDVIDAITEDDGAERNAVFNTNFGDGDDLDFENSFQAGQDGNGSTFALIYDPDLDPNEVFPNPGYSYPDSAASFGPGTTLQEMVDGLSSYALAPTLADGADGGALVRTGKWYFYGGRNAQTAAGELIVASTSGDGSGAAPGVDTFNSLEGGADEAAETSGYGDIRDLMIADQAIDALMILKNADGSPVVMAFANLAGGDDNTFAGPFSLWSN